MNTERRVNRATWGLGLCSIVVALFGCSAAPFAFGLQSTFRPAPPATPARAPRAKPAPSVPKPTDADDDSYERHPHRWHKRLRAKYA